jgi:signal transduction histidine kinase
MASPGVAGNQAELPFRQRFSFPHWLRNPAGALIIAALVFGLLGTFTLAIEIGRPFGGYATYGYIDRGLDYISSETPLWWPPIADGSLTIDDQFLSINGLPYRENMWREMARAYRSGERVTLETQAMGSADPRTVSIAPIVFTIQDFLDIKLPDLLVGGVFWLLAVIILRARPEATTNQVFAATAACMALQRLTGVVSLAMDDRLLINLLKGIHLFVSGLIAALIFHLALVFPWPMKRRRRGLLAIIYAIGITSGLVLAATRLPFWAAVPERADFLLDNISYRTMVYLVLLAILALFSRLIWIRIRQRGDLRHRRVVAIVLSGLIFSLPAVAVILAPAIPIIGPRMSAFWAGLDLRYMMLAIPIAFAFAIIRYQTFQSLSPLFVFVIVLSLSALLAAVGAAVWVQSQPADALPQRPPFSLLFVFILLASVFWRRQANWQGWLGRYLHRAERNYESARAFGDRIMGSADLRELPATMAQALVDELEVERAGVWLWQPAASQYELAAFAGRRLPPPPVILIPPQQQPAAGGAWRVAAPSMPGWLREAAAAGQFEVMAPLAAGGRPIGLLGLGRRWDEEIFDERDLAVAELVAQQAALFVLAATQVEELRRVPNLISEAQERERYRLAAELHDTIQQFLGRLPFFLTVSRELIAGDGERAAALIDRCIDDVGQAAIELRQIRANLAPNQLESSLLKPLDSLAAHVERQNGLAVRLRAPRGLDSATTADTRLALYRVIQQALDNAVAHAQATEVTVTLSRQNGRVRFEVADNGRGSSEIERRASLMEGGFGLQSMRARVEAVGGEFKFHSADGRGTTVSGWVPAAETMNT